MMLLTFVSCMLSPTPKRAPWDTRARVRPAHMEMESFSGAPPSPPPIIDLRKRQVLEVAQSMQACDQAAAEAERLVLEEERSWIRNLYTLFGRKQRPGSDEAAATLVDVGSDILTVIENNDMLYLSREISLQSTASELVSEMMSEVSDELNEAVAEAARECSEAIGALGRAAQSSLVSSVAPQWQSKPKSWEVALASSKAQKAVEKLASTCAATPAHVLMHGKTSASASMRIDQAWRRDALRALNALQRAPEQIQLEMKRLRFRKIRDELKMLGLQAACVDTLTLDDLRAARARRAKELHPDVSRAAPGRRERLISGLLGERTARRVRRSMLPSSAGHWPPAGGRETGAADDEAMVELNRAYDTVRKAMTAPMYL